MQSESLVVLSNLKNPRSRLCLWLLLSSHLYVQIDQEFPWTEGQGLSSAQALWHRADETSLAMTASTQETFPSADVKMGLKQPVKFQLFPRGKF